MDRVKCVIWDLDNCLSDDRRRIPLIDWHLYPRDTCWDRYHSACEQDPEPPPIHRMIFERWHANHDIGQRAIFITARPERVRAETIRWITHNLPFMQVRDWELYMRKPDDARRSVDIKRDVLRVIRTDPSRILVHGFDDQADIVAMYHEEGLPATVLRIHEIESHRPPAVMAQGARSPLPVEAFAMWTAEASGLAARAEDLGPIQGAKPPSARGVPTILQEAAETFASRNTEYSDAYRKFGAVLAAMFPGGLTIPAGSPHDFGRLALLVMGLGKWHRYATNFAAGGHPDSIHDAVIYAAMLEQMTAEGMEPKKNGCA